MQELRNYLVSTSTKLARYTFMTIVVLSVMKTHGTTYLCAASTHYIIHTYIIYIYMVRVRRMDCKIFTF